MSEGRRTRGGTRERVLDGALELFNRDGTARVTTNHIAAHVGISPGNLYYWFRDKPEIVRALFERYAGAHSRLWDGLGAAGGPRDLMDRLVATTELSSTYRFLARDLLALVHGDTELLAAYVAVRAARLATFRALARRWRDAGVVRPLPDERLDDVVQALWVVAEAWWPFAELGGADPAPEQGERLLRAVLDPYLVTAAPTAPDVPTVHEVPAPTPSLPRSSSEHR